MQRTRVVTPPSAGTYVLTLAEVCAQARIEPGMDDATILRYQVAAVQHIESVYGLALLTQTKELVMDEWPGGYISLVDYPVTAITSVKYTLADGSEATWSSTNYEVGLNSQPVRIAPKLGATWPSAGGLRQVEAVAVRYTAGFGAGLAPGAAIPTPGTAAVPEALRQAVALLAADWYIRREDTGSGILSKAIQHGLNALVSQWR